MPYVFANNPIASAIQNAAGAVAAAPVASAIPVKNVTNSLKANEDSMPSYSGPSEGVATGYAASFPWENFRTDQTEKLANAEYAAPRLFENFGFENFGADLSQPMYKYNPMRALENGASAASKPAENAANVAMFLQALQSLAPDFNSSNNKNKNKSSKENSKNNKK